MSHSAVKIMAATALYLGTHSLLASRRAKGAAARLLGERRRNAFYRPFYQAVSVGGLWALVGWSARQPDRELYVARGRPACLMRLGQLLSTLMLLDATRRVGFGLFLGLPGLVAWCLGRSNVPREPEAQGPGPGPGGSLDVSGPFRLSRHPQEFWMLPALWLSPRMTVNYLAFNALVTLYCVLGCRNEEARLRETYGQEYRDYQRSGIRFFVPSCFRRHGG